MKPKFFRRAVGLLLLADGIRAFARPAQYSRSFQFGSPLIDDILDYFAENPRLIRNFSVVEMTIGAWLALS
ncbi:MAG: hypothetical protein WB992_20310 [Bryobacteraceae bacterium]